MFAVVDIETTGGSLKQGSRITEVAVVIHNGTTIEHRFSTLINPETDIPSFIIGLTGITNELVENAPCFKEIAGQLLQLLDGKIFVAHNASFDFSFIKAEFKRCGIDFNAEVLCTCSLSRKFFPGFGSYSLGNLTKNLGIVLEGHHRAMNDAIAASEILEKLVSERGLEHTLLHRSVPIKNTEIPYELINKLPEVPGIYFFTDSNHEILYIGKAKNIKKRVTTHFRNNNSKSKKIKALLHDICYMNTGCELLACLLEIQYIKEYQPFFNRAGKSEKNFGVYIIANLNGLLGFTIDDIEKTSLKPLRYFGSRKAADEFLSHITAKYNLCRCINNLENYSENCFYKQIKQCNGTDLDSHEKDNYNNRFNDAYFEVVDDGLHDAALAYPMADNDEWVYVFRQNGSIGYYFGKKATTFNTNQIISVTFLKNHLESHRIFNSFLKKPSARRIKIVSDES
ncbi:MAG: GIY-YIG nuclease family protein [Bacteroidia bacterium]|nr:GIY-YIG nuclease family protein [Bacteroidia bacterium]